MALATALSSAPNFVIDQGLEYYAGKTELLDWINRLLELNLTRLEQLTSGAVYCQILDAFYTDIVAIRKVNFFAREEYEIVPNYKVLQAAFNALGLTKELNVAKLSQASTPELMELAQWLYKSFKGVDTLPGYSPTARRQLSIKGGTCNIPLPASVVNSAFEFSRIDLRTSGNWGGATTPQDPNNKAFSRTQRSTPSTGGKLSGGRRTPPYLNVTSRYREGLAVPPDHYDRRSPRLSPGSTGGALIRRVFVAHGSTQTDFPDEDYRPMTAADVGTEVVSPRLERRDYAVQYEEALVYNNSVSPSGSSVSPPGSALVSHGLPNDAFSFGRRRTGIPLAPGISGSPRGTSSPSASGQTLAEASGPDANGSHPDGWARGAGRGGEDDDDARGAAPAPQSNGGPAYDAGPSADSGEPLLRRRTREEEKEEVEVGSFGGAAAEAAAAAATAAAAAADDTPEKDVIPSAFSSATEAAAIALAMDGALSLRPAPAAPAQADKPEEEQVECSFRAASSGSAGIAEVPSAAVGSTEQGPPEALGSAVNGSPSLGGAAREGGGAGAAPGSAGSLPPRELVASPGGASSTATASAAASPSPRSGGQRWRSSGAALPPDVASLLASPVARTRLASPSCLRDMSNALDVCAAALQAADKSLGSYTTLLEAPPPLAAAAAAAPVAQPTCSPALCGKARSLQDALQTLLEHVALLLSDVQAYSQATHTQHQQQRSYAASPASAGVSPAGRLVAAAGKGAGPSPAAASPDNGGGPPPRNFQAEAAVLLERARAQEDRLEALSRRAKEVLQLPGDAANAAGEEAAASPRPGAAAGASASTAASGGSAFPNRHLTEEQRKLCATAQLDAHLKAVGMAQFTLAQDIHKELAALTTAYFRHNTVTGGGDGGSTGGGGDGSTGGVSTSSNRKARVFKLGEYQLKQLRNGDIYKGRYVCNKKNGEGVYHFINADVYEGEFRDDRMDGYGVYTFSHEGRYEGQWRNAVYNGTGAETFAKGSTYHGEYAGGLRNGWGVCRFYNGDYYEGQWAKGLRDGSGMQQCTDDSNFVGDYQRGKRHGHGVYSFPNGDRYEGQYCEDLPHGYGTYHFASGQCYQGQWQQGKKHGWSVYTVDNGNRFMGLWSEGKPTWVQPLNGDAVANGSEDTGRSLRQALEARDRAVKAGGDARRRAASHWDVSGPVQSRLQAALGQAQGSAALSQQARRKACDLAARLDAAVALLQTQGGGAPVVSATP
ncbi:hypothetical protein PLESTF_001343500 [Pleodorina starrii]|nr:hypothetical protein PLESTF_001343500 [Pleodorina starrii]